MKQKRKIEKTRNTKEWKRNKLTTKKQQKIKKYRRQKMNYFICVSLSAVRRQRYVTVCSKGPTIPYCGQLRNCDTSLCAIKELRYVTARRKGTAIRHCAQLRNYDTSLHAVKEPRYVTVRS
jgi:hypothetical protein